VVAINILFVINLLTSNDDDSFHRC